jgi:hypothetical protein
MLPSGYIQTEMDAARKISTPAAKNPEGAANPRDIRLGEGIEGRSCAIMGSYEAVERKYIGLQYRTI